MTMVSRIALGLTLALGAAGAATLPLAATQAQEAEAYQPDLSKKFRKPISEVQTALQAEDLATAQAKLAEAEAAVQNADDAYVLNQFKVNLALKRDDRAAVAPALEGMLNSGSEALTPESRATYLQQLGALALEREDRAAAAGYFQQLADLQPNNADAIFNVGVLQLQGGDNAGAYQNFERAIAAREASGQIAEENWYRQLLKIAYDSEMDIVEPSMRLVKAYPTPENWRSALILFRDGAQDG